MCALKRRKSKGYTLEMMLYAKILYRAYRYTRNTQKFTTCSIAASTEFVRGLDGPAGFLVFFETDLSEQGRHHAPGAAVRGNGQSRGAHNGRNFAVPVAILRSQEHDATICPPEAEADNTGEDEPEAGKEHPMLTHLYRGLV